MKLCKILTPLLVVLGACNGLIGSGGGTGSGGVITPEEATARAKFKAEAYPIFSSVCFSCHGGSMMQGAPSFVQAMSVEEMRETLLAADPQVVNVEAPESSRVLNKGAHHGTPALDAVQTSAILDWIQAEHDAAMSGGDVLPTTEKFDVLPCTNGAAGDPTCPVNSVALDKLGLPGAKITFIAQQYGSNTYISDLYLSASADGAYLEHPLFVSWPATGAETPDSADRFNAVKLNLVATTAAPVCPGPSCDHIGFGAAAFVGFPITNKLSITFQKLDKYEPDGTPPPKEVGCGTMGFASFLANVKPNMESVCKTCHAGQNTGATAAMDITGLENTGDNSTCLQVRGHIVTGTPATSPLLLAPQMGQDPTHPAGGKLSATTTPTITQFQTAVTTWINVEANE